MPTTLRVRSHELDPYGHVNHAVYLTYLEVARIDHLAVRGIDLLELAGRTGAQLVVAGIEVDELAAAVAGDELTVTCTLQERRRAPARFVQEIHREATVLVRARVRTAMIDPAGRPVALPEELVTAMEGPVAR
ncbi:MAG: acyl-CoA thioesterase [Nitriliruptor sp.]|nr:MAG: acyl-CoA thioesterase [Nitriliruptor sp.]